MWAGTAPRRPIIGLVLFGAATTFFAFREAWLLVLLDAPLTGYFLYHSAHSLRPGR